MEKNSYSRSQRRNSNSRFSPVVSPSVAPPVPAVSLDTDVEMENANGDAATASSVSTESDVKVNINVEAAAALLLVSAKEDLDRKKNDYYIFLGNYLAASKVDPSSDATRSAFQLHKETQESFLEAEKTLKVLKASNAPPGDSTNDKKSMLVPNNLPFLQLRSDSHIVKPNRDVFDSVYDFCQEFTTFGISFEESLLESHSLSLDDSWERLLPPCLNKEERSWFEDKLKGKAYKWKKAESILLDHYDTPFRKFLNMGRVWCMKQGKGESARSFGAKFQKFRRQASLEDGVQLVLCFWWNLRPEVREACIIPISANYGSKMPDKIEDIISLVSASTSDSADLLRNPGETKDTSAWNSFATGNGSAPSSLHKGRKRPSSGECTWQEAQEVFLGFAQGKKKTLFWRCTWQEAQEVFLGL
ncbi:hypothetical protein MFLAVUS_011329 [Mucor flavus]|uniref:Uncharacterized protein n=1 Tax=Mucor flavus TaxID=439312 RepID=A0ABP9ZF98_9FUNG